MSNGHGVDRIDVTSGGLVPGARIEVESGDKVPFARAVREGAGLPVSAVGLITVPEQADQILVDRSANATCSPARCCATRRGRCAHR